MEDRPAQSSAGPSNVRASMSPRRSVDTKEIRRSTFRLNLLPDFHTDEHLISDEKLEAAWQLYSKGVEDIDFLSFRGACYYLHLHSRDEDLHRMFDRLDVENTGRINFRKYCIGVQLQNRKDRMRLHDVKSDQVIQSKSYRHPAHHFRLYREPQKKRWICWGRNLPGGCRRGDPTVTTVDTPCFASRRDPNFKLCEQCFGDRTRSGDERFEPEDAVEEIRLRLQEQTKLEMEQASRHQPGTAGDVRTEVRTPDMDELMEATFARFDLDNSGVIDFEEFRAAWCWLGIDASEKELKKTFDHIDVDKSGKIELDEYKNAFGSSPLHYEDVEESDEEFIDGEFIPESPGAGQGKDYINFDEIKSTFHTSTTLPVSPDEFNIDDLEIAEPRQPRIGENIQFRLPDGAWVKARIREQIGDQTVVVNSEDMEADECVHWNSPRIKLKDDGNPIAMALRMWNSFESLESIADALKLDGRSDQDQLKAQMYVMHYISEQKLLQLSNEEQRKQFLSDYIEQEQHHHFADKDDEDFLPSEVDMQHRWTVGSIILAQTSNSMDWEKMKIVQIKQVPHPDNPDETIQEVVLLPTDWHVGAGVEAYQLSLEQRRNRSELTRRRSSIFSIVSDNLGYTSDNDPANGDPVEARTTTSQTIIPVTSSNFTIKKTKHIPPATLQFPLPSDRDQIQKKLHSIPKERLLNEAQLWIHGQKRMHLYIHLDHCQRQFPELDRDDLSRAYDPHRDFFSSLDPSDPHERVVCDLAVSNTGSIVSASHDQTLRLWRKRGYKVKCQQFMNCKTGVLSCDITRDGSLIAGGTYGCAVELWDGHSLTKVHEIPTCWSVPAVAFHPTNTTLAVSNGSGDRCLRLWDLHALTPAMNIIGFKYSVFDMNIHPNGDLLLAASKNKTHLFDIRVGKALCVPHRSRDNFLTCTRFLEQSSEYAILDKDRIRIFDIRRNEEAVFDTKLQISNYSYRDTTRHNFASSLALNSEFIALGYLNGCVDVLHMDNFLATGRYDECLASTDRDKRLIHSKEVTALVFHESNLISCGKDKEVVLSARLENRDGDLSNEITEVSIEQ